MKVRSAEQLQQTVESKGNSQLSELLATKSKLDVSNAANVKFVHDLRLLKEENAILMRNKPDGDL